MHRIECIITEQTKKRPFKKYCLCFKMHTELKYASNLILTINYKVNISKEDSPSHSMSLSIHINNISFIKYYVIIVYTIN